MKRLLVSYSNCQGQGLIHFLKKTPLADEFEAVHWNNYQLILKEVDRDECFESLKRADVVIFQPTSALHCIDGFVIPDSETLFHNLLRPDAIRIGFVYQYNHGFFPIVRLGPTFDGWVTGDYIKRHVKYFPDGMLLTYDTHAHRLDDDHIPWDCARRFAECLGEQSRREQEANADIKMTDFILANFQTRRLFLTQNHPSSVMFVELAKRVIARLVEPFGLWEMVRRYSDSKPHETEIVDRVKDIPWTDPNEANLPGMLPVHPAVVRELNLKYPADADCGVYRIWLEEMIKESK